MKKNKTQYPVSMIILAWNNRQDLQNCVESIVNGTTISYQMIIVNNGSVDDTREYLDALEKGWDSKNLLTVIHNEHNLGYAKGNNVALPMIQGEYTLFLNQDIIVRAGAIDQMVEFIQDNAHSYQAVAPQLRYPDGRIQESCRDLPTPKNMVYNMLLGKWRNTFDHTQSQICEQPMASAIMIRTDIVLDMKGFDDHEDYWLFFNDVDLSKQLREKGYVTYFLSESVMEHHHGASTRKLVNWKKRRYWYRGFRRYFTKWYGIGIVSVVLISLLGLVLTGGLLVRDMIKK